MSLSFLRRCTRAVSIVSWCVICRALAYSAEALNSDPLHLPAIGSHELRVLSPTILELSLMTTKEPDPARSSSWDFVDASSKLNLPPANEFQVSVAGRGATVSRIGFKRRVLYAPLKVRDLRIANHLYLEISPAIAEGQTVEVKNPSKRLWPETMVFRALADPRRWNPAVHVNQLGYLPGHEKKAMVGYYLGSLGEMKVPAAGVAGSGFSVVDAESGKVVHQGTLKRRRDVGFTFPCYQEVWEADFTELSAPGVYRLQVPGLGVSFPFRVEDGIAAGFARTYALGLYHQRCGSNNALPFTRFVHEPCHRAPAHVPLPTQSFRETQELLRKMVSEGGGEGKQRARAMTSIGAGLYPYVSRGAVDVACGHHDAGDYSKYTINSAALIHSLVFAADAFPGVGELDNLGLPESGDGRSDLLQEAKWEADFLAKMQDGDGGFYFLVYPRERPYEDDVLPDRGDPQVVFPKNTSATAAAVAALAQASSSPLFRKQFPEAAAAYLEQAKKGWTFLTRAMSRYGRDGAYQKISHYGHEFGHDDELAWAATELFLATGDRDYEKHLLAHFDPASRDTKRWTWWRLFEGYGNAIRSYAFAVQTGRLRVGQLDGEFLAKCRDEIVAAARDQARFAKESAYGTSFPEPTKRFRTAGWYFSSDRAFDLATAAALQPALPNAERAEFLGAILSNLSYEAGCNPVNVSYVTGLGWKRPRDIVHQYAQNDRRTLPPSGIPIGNIQAGFQFLHHYGKELGALSFPPDGAETDPYPFYDRWGDSFNTTAEFVISNQGRALATAAFLMAQTPLRSQPWRMSAGRIAGVPGDVAVGQSIQATVELSDPRLDLRDAQVVWEAIAHSPRFGERFTFVAKDPGVAWIEAEVQWPDGRRVFAVKEFQVRAAK